VQDRQWSDTATGAFTLKLDEGAIRLPLRGQHRLATAPRDLRGLLLFPVSPERTNVLRAPAARAVYPHCPDSIRRMLDELDALTEKLREIQSRLATLRDENQRLRTQVAHAHVELDAMRSRVAGAMQRIDSLLEQLPAAAERSDSAPDSR
jgi:septal ring factor EnvC (AmiA/AmiB activator)